MKILKFLSISISLYGSPQIVKAQNNDLFLTLYKEKGDILKGKIIYTKNCVICHGGESVGKIKLPNGKEHWLANFSKPNNAPSLQGAGAKKATFLINSLILPNAKTSLNFKYQIYEKEGVSVVVRKVTKKNMISYKDLSGKVVDIKGFTYKKDVQIMPSYRNILNEDQFRDLFEYLQSL